MPIARAPKTAIAVAISASTGRKNASFRVLWLNLRGIGLARHPFVITLIMPTTTSNSPLRKQASAAIDTVAADIQNAARQELDSLRNTVNVRLAALERTLGREENDPAFQAIVEKLCEVAAEQTDAACTWTRAQLEDAAAKELAAVRARAKADLDRAQADLDAATALMDETRAEFEQRLAKADAAAVDTARTLAEFKTQAEMALREAEQRFGEAEKRIAKSEAARLEAVQALAETERVAAAARQEADAAAASLAEARTQIASLEGVRSDLMLAHKSRKRISKAKSTTATSSPPSSRPRARKRCRPSRTPTRSGSSCSAPPRGSASSRRGTGPASMHP